MFDIPRKLIYQERHSLEDFGVYDKTGNSYNRFLYTELLKRKSPTSSIDRTEEILSVFNNAYYLCTLFLIDPSPEARIAGYCHVAQYCNNYSPLISNQIIALFYFYLYNMNSFDELVLKIDEFTNLMDDTMDLDVENEIEVLLKRSKGYKGLLVLPEDFALRKVSDELLYSIDWKCVTKNFNYCRIYFIAKSLYTDNLDKCNMLDSICQQMEKDENLDKGIRKEKERFIVFLKYGFILGQEEGDEKKELVSFLKEKEETENYRYNLEEKYAALQNDYEAKKRECVELRKENDELKERLKESRNGIDKLFKKNEVYDENEVTSTNPRSGGRKQESLFKSKSGGKDEELTKAKASDFTNYLKKQGLIDTVIDTSRENEVNKAFVNFYIKWIAEENIALQPNGNACFRFLKEDCALEMASSESGYIKTYGDFIRKMISEEI